MLEKIVEGDIITIKTSHARILTLLENGINAKIELNNKRRIEKDLEFVDYCDRENETLKEYLMMINA